MNDNDFIEFINFLNKYNINYEIRQSDAKYIKILKPNTSNTDGFGLINPTVEFQFSLEEDNFDSYIGINSRKFNISDLQEFINLFNKMRINFITERNKNDISLIITNGSDKNDIRNMIIEFKFTNKEDFISYNICR